jgi:hypothetical protein
MPADTLSTDILGAYARMTLRAIQVWTGLQNRAIAASTPAAAAQAAAVRRMRLALISEVFLGAGRPACGDAV